MKHLPKLFEVCVASLHQKRLSISLPTDLVGRVGLALIHWRTDGKILKERGNFVPLDFADQTSVISVSWDFGLFNDRHFESRGFHEALNLKKHIWRLLSHIDCQVQVRNVLRNGIIRARCLF